jgi:hypothetical protein
MIGSVRRDAFAECQPMGYALGCQVESYRGTRIVRHGGNLAGYASDVTVVPGEDVGIAILTNQIGTGMRDALPLMLLDRLLGLDPVPWGERYFELISASRSGAREARQHRQSRARGVRPSRDLDAYVGSYSHPAHGTLRVDRDGEGLVPSFHDLGELHRLEHRNQDAYDLWFVEFDTAVPATFTQNIDGDVDGVQVGLEPLVAPIVFERDLDDPIRQHDGPWPTGD